MATEIRSFPSDYAAVLHELKERVRSARLTAQRRVNTELISLYWSVGNTIFQRQVDDEWERRLSHALPEIFALSSHRSKDSRD